MTARYIVGDTRVVLGELPAGSVDLVVTSPPYLALRSYLPAGHPAKVAEMGSEANPAGFVDALLDVIEELGRVLAPHGSICVELGDTYSGSGGAGGDYDVDGLRAGQERFDGSARRGRQRVTLADGHTIQGNGIGNGAPRQGAGWPLDKSLCMIPESVRWALTYGHNPFNRRSTPRWRVRNVVRHFRPNPPVGALGDKVRPATSDWLVACKSRDRYFDLDDPALPPTHPDCPTRTSPHRLPVPAPPAPTPTPTHHANPSRSRTPHPNCCTLSVQQRS